MNSASFERVSAESAGEPARNIYRVEVQLDAPLDARRVQSWLKLSKALQPFMFGSHAAYYEALESILTEKPYLLRTVIAPGTQPLVSTRQPKKVVEALKKLDFFVVVDVARTADMDYADIVIPVATSYEIDHPFEGGGILGGGWLMARNKVIEPVGSPKSIFEFFLDLGVAMGYGDQFWNGSMT